MPHAELKYSSDLDFDPVALLADIEATILEHDDGSGACKGRAYPAGQFHHTHCLLNVSMLTKAHRDAAFTQRLLKSLDATLRRHVRQSCFLSLGITYTDETYLTSQVQASS